MSHGIITPQQTLNPIPHVNQRKPTEVTNYAARKLQTKSTARRHQIRPKRGGGYGCTFRSPNRVRADATAARRGAALAERFGDAAGANNRWTEQSESIVDEADGAREREVD